MATETEVSPQAEENAATAVGIETELSCMGDIAKALGTISGDSATLQRVLTWVNQRYGVTLPKRGDETERERNRQNGGMKPTSLAAGENKLPFDSLADLFASASPTTEADKALVAAYWFQVHQGQTDWTGYTVNSELKHLGHGIGNITNAVESLISQKPQLAIQTRKSGKSQQARKLYKLTTEGQKRVREIVSSSAGADGLLKS